MRGRVKVYLDTSVYNRPFDDQSQTRIRLEAEAFLSFIEKAIHGSITIIGSSALLYENSRNPLAERKERVSSFLEMVAKVVKASATVRRRAIFLESLGIDSIDALHLACAEAGGAEYFVTCDDAIIKRAKKNQAVLKVAVRSPLAFALEEVFQHA
jgi:predicted nucleic acid-binding protein